jgi:hypothetical protein
LSPQTALTLLENNFIKLATVVALDAKSYEMRLLRAPKNGVAGGRIYDAVIGACAEQGKVSTVLTFNVGDFTALGQDFDGRSSGNDLGRCQTSENKTLRL